jgi:circadian clock protein KaiC
VDDRRPFPALSRLATGVPGLDAVLGGGLLAGDAYLIVGAPGTGKTTLGNQLAYAHAAAGGSALVATLLTETHDRMLGHLRGFAFFDPALAGDRVRYLSLLRLLEEGGVDGLLGGLWRAVREQGASLLVVDGTAAAEELVPSGFAYGRFVQGLQARSAVAGCTAVLLSTGREAGGFGPAAAHADGILELALAPAGPRDARWLRVAKLRGAAYLGGHHHFVIGPAGVEVFPRLEAALGAAVPAPLEPGERLGTGVAGLDAMLGGGLPERSSTMVLGTPGAGKTLLGLHFLAEGAWRGEPGLAATFHETAEALAATAEGVGQELGRHVESGLVRVLWRPPLELSPDQWARDLLAAVAEHRPRRLVVDAFTDLARLFVHPERQVPFLAALTNELRARGVTVLANVELEAYAGPGLLPPIPAVSAAMDNGLLLRTAEMGSRLVRVVSVLKTRQVPFDHAIREFAIGAGGIAVGGRVEAATGLLTGSAVPTGGNGEEPAG